MAKPPSPPPRADPDRLIAAARQHLRAGRLREAIEGFALATKGAPRSVAAWTGLGNALHRAGKKAEGSAAHMRALQASAQDPVFVSIAQGIKAGQLDEVHKLLVARLRADPGEAPSLRLMALLALRASKPVESFALLVRLIELTPMVEGVLDMARRALYAMPPHTAHAAIDAQLARQPGHPGYRSFKASLLERGGDYAGAIAMHRAILAQAPTSAGSWIALGDVLEMTGETQEAIAAYRHALSLRSINGYAWWSLANIKINRFSPGEHQAMRDLLARSDLPEQERMMTAFALGKALEDAGDPEGSFTHYAQGNALRRASQPYDHARTLDQLERARRLFTPAFFEARDGQGDPASDPIFIVGVPRSGSTLVEHILAAHHAIEGTMELPDLPRAVMRLDGSSGRYPEAITNLDGTALAAIGQTYLAESRVQRRCDKPHFIDKLPANFRHVGLIRAALPNAKIIDVRRHPLACGFSCYRQFFASGFDFANDLGDLGHYYRAYVETMAHWDAVLPGHVHRIFYENLIADPEAELRRLLAYLGLPFDAACLGAHRSARPVRTPSASQVRQPIYRDALDSWQPFEPWLGPLKAALGDVLDHYPVVPRN